VSELWDTTIVIDLLRGHPPAVAYADQLLAPPSCSEITRVEVMRGVRNGERRSTERLLATFGWIAVDEAVARAAGELGRASRRSDQGIATADLVIAATATLSGLKLVTLNARHFPTIPGVVVPYRP
jgi:predicted nucleic acid-binding protein